MSGAADEERIANRIAAGSVKSSHWTFELPATLILLIATPASRRTRRNREQRAKHRRHQQAHSGAPFTNSGGGSATN